MPDQVVAAPDAAAHFMRTIKLRCNMLHCSAMLIKDMGNTMIRFF
jgi:hypothetical protein